MSYTSARRTCWNLVKLPNSDVAVLVMHSCRVLARRVVDDRIPWTSALRVGCLQRICFCSCFGGPLANRACVEPSGSRTIGIPYAHAHGSGESTKTTKTNLPWATANTSMTVSRHTGLITFSTMYVCQRLLTSPVPMSRSYIPDL